MKWEYLTRSIAWENADPILDVALDEMGEENWELVAVAGNIAYFRRPKGDKIPVRVGPQETKEVPYV